MLNAVFNKTQFWDGRAADLKEQVVSGVMANPTAMLKARGGPIIGEPAREERRKQHVVESSSPSPVMSTPLKRRFRPSRIRSCMTILAERSPFSRRP